MLMLYVLHRHIDTCLCILMCYMLIYIMFAYVYICVSELNEKNDKEMGGRIKNKG